MKTLKLTSSRLSRLLAAAFVSAAAFGSAACTTTQVPEATEQQLPDELATTDHVHTYGVIEDDLEAYPWTGERYEDPRFAAELDNSPLNGEDDYKPLFADDTKKSSVKMTKASKKKSKSSKKASAKSRKAR